MKIRLINTLQRLTQNLIILGITSLSLAVPLSADAVTGTFAWSVQDSGADGFGHILLDSTGNVIESAFTGANVTKYGSNGQVTWSHQFPILFHGLSGFLSGHMAIDSGGNIYITTLIDYRQNDGQFAIVGAAKISSGGTLLWANTFNIGTNGGEHMAVGPMVLGNNGSLYVVGTGANFSQPTAPATILRINTSTGAEQNRVAAGGSSDFGADMPLSAIAVDSANNVFYGGPEGIHSYSSSLQGRWSNTQMAVTAIVLDAANNVYVGGNVADGSGVVDFVTKRLNNANGSQVWNFQLFEAVFPGCTALALDSRGQLYAVGGADINAQSVFKLDPATGNSQWVQYNGESIDNSVALDANDNVYVVGTDGLSSSGNALISVYDPLGNLLWSQSFSRAGNLGESFVNVAVDNKGNVYAAGGSKFEIPPGSQEITITPEVIKYTESGLVFSGTYRVINRNSAKALDAVGQGTANGTQIDQWTYSGANNQRWTVTSLGYNQYKIIGVQSGRSVDVAGSGTANGTKIDLWDYNAGNNQKFAFTATSGGYYRITPANATGSCLDVAGASTANGALVDLWQYTGGNNQQWILQAP